MNGLWDQLRSYGAAHGVDPRIFAGLYFARLPFLLGTLAVLVRRAGARRPAAPIAVAFLALGVFPYAYILAFGRNLPPWFTAAVAAVAALTLAQGVRKIRKSLRGAARAG